MELIKCGCTTGCTGKQCSCNKIGLVCTDICLCTDCRNNQDTYGPIDDGEESDVSDEEESEMETSTG